MKPIDFSLCPTSGRFYGGSERKFGILYEGAPYLLKFPKKTAFGDRSNTISEFLGSKIYAMIGIPVQEIEYGFYQGEEVVACKDFRGPKEWFVPFNDVGESTIETDPEEYQYSYQDIVTLLRLNRKLTDCEAVVSRFFDMFIVDALLGNFDRHGANWGFLKKDSVYRIAPVFDNGSCLFPNLTDEEEMRRVLNDREEMNRRVYESPTSQIKLNGQKSSYFHVISSLSMDEMNQALLRIFPEINLPSILSFIDSVEWLSPLRKDFYKAILAERYEKILQEPYKRLKERAL